MVSSKRVKAKDMPEWFSDELKKALSNNVNSLIAKVIRTKLTTQLTPIMAQDIKLTGLKTTIKKLDIDKAIQAKLADNIDEVKAFIEQQEGLYIQGRKSYPSPRIGQDNPEYEDLTQYLEQVDREVKGYKFKTWRVKDEDGLIKAIKSKFNEATTYGLLYPIDETDGGVVSVAEQHFKSLLEAKKLNDKLGIKPSGKIVVSRAVNTKTGYRNFTVGGRRKDEANTIITVARESDEKTQNIILLALLSLAEKQEAKATTRDRQRVNLIDGHDGLPRPATTTLSELFESATINDERLTKIYDDYRTPEALKEAGGYKVKATQELLPIFKASNDYRTHQEMIRANIPILEKVLITLLREVERTGGYNTTPRWSKIADLAKPMYEAQIAKRGKLDTKYKQAYVNNLHLLDALQFYNYEKPSKRNKGGGIYTKFKFIEITKLDINKKGYVTDINWRLSDNFIKLIPRLIFVNTDKFLQIQSSNAQMLATYINDSLVKSAKRTEDTIAGLPITISAKTLADKAGLGDGNPTNRYRLLTESLNELKSLSIIAKWETADGETTIKKPRSGKIPKVTIWPSKNVSGSYISKKLNDGVKQQEQVEQAKRQKELSELLDYYRNDLKNNKYATEYKEALAEDLETTAGKIDLMLVKPTKTQKPDEINDDMLAKIRELKKDYEY